MKNLNTIRKRVELKEKLFDILEENIDIINKEINRFKKTFFDGERFDSEQIKKIMIGEEFVFSKIKSLEGELFAKAQKLNPVYIKIGVFESNSYSPFENEINLGFTHNVISIIQKFWMTDPTLDEVARSLGRMEKQYKKEFDEKIKIGTIAHELAHYLDDTFQNDNIRNSLLRVKDYVEKDGKGRKYSYSKVFNSDNIDASFMEINAQIHAIAELKRSRYSKKEWDVLSFEDMLKDYPATNAVLSNLSISERKSWKKNLIKRMDREGLLGKNMLNN